MKPVLKIIITFLAVAVTAWGVFLSTFPLVELGKWAENKARATGMTLEVRRPAFDFPCSLEVGGLNAGWGASMEPLEVRHVHITPAWSRILSGVPAVKMTGAAGRGTLEFVVGGWPGNDIAVVGTFAGVALEDVVPDNGGAVFVAGTLDGGLDIRMQGTRPAGLNGRANLELSSGKVDIDMPLFQGGFAELAGSAAAVMKNGRLEVIDTAVRGKGIEATLSGSVAIVSPLERCRLNLEGALKGPLAAGLSSSSRGAVVRISGTVDSPEVSLK